MQLFQLIRNPQFFSLLSSPNREIYVEALFVVFRCYKQELMIRRQDLIDRLVAALEDRMFELADEEGDAIDDGSLSGRAHWLLRRMIGAGWVELDPTAHTVEEYVALPDYSVRILQVLHEICEDKPKEYNSLVYSTYSNLSQLTVHHIDHNHDNNPADGSNWELLCLYCHDHEHSKYTIQGSAVIAGEKGPQVKYNPFANLKSMLDKE